MAREMTGAARFRLGKILEQGGRTREREVVASLYTTPERASSRSRSRRGRQHEEEDDHGVVVASSTMERMRMNSSSLILTKGYGGLVWPCCWASSWASVGLLHGLHDQVGLVSSLLFFFYLFNFCFQLHGLNSYFVFIFCLQVFVINLVYQFSPKY